MEVERLQSAKVFGEYADVGEVGENVCGVGVAFAQGGGKSSVP